MHGRPGHNTQSQLTFPGHGCMDDLDSQATRVIDVLCIFFDMLSIGVCTACKREKPSTSMTHVAFESKLRSVARSFMHPCPGNWVPFGRAVMYGRAAHALSAGIK